MRCYVTYMIYLIYHVCQEGFSKPKLLLFIACIPQTAVFDHEYF